MRLRPPSKIAARSVATCVALLVIGVPLTSFGSESDSVSAFRDKMAKWVETRQIVSEERAEWLVEKETLEATLDLLRAERKDLRAEVKEFQETGAGADEERRELLLRRAEHQRFSAALATQIADLEAQVLALAPQLPGPLQNRLELLLVQIPEDPEESKVPLGQRLMNVLGVLAQTEKWNSTATFVGETRDVGGSGQKVAVRTLYWGLAEAIYVDTNGEVAGMGRPTAEGWEFIDDPSLAADAQLLLDIYEGNVDTIAFVPIPIELD